MIPFSIFLLRNIVVCDLTIFIHYSCWWPIRDIHICEGHYYLETVTVVMSDSTDVIDDVMFIFCSIRYAVTEVLIFSVFSIVFCVYSIVSLPVTCVLCVCIVCAVQLFCPTFRYLSRLVCVHSFCVTILVVWPHVVVIISYFVVFIIWYIVIHYCSDDALMSDIHHTLSKCCCDGVYSDVEISYSFNIPFIYEHCLYSIWCLFSPTSDDLWYGVVCILQWPLILIQWHDMSIQTCGVPDILSGSHCWFSFLCVFILFGWYRGDWCSLTWYNDGWSVFSNHYYYVCLFIIKWPSILLLCENIVLKCLKPGLCPSLKWPILNSAWLVSQVIL